MDPHFSVAMKCAQEVAMGLRAMFSAAWVWHPTESDPEVIAGTCLEHQEE